MREEREEREDPEVATYMARELTTLGTVLSKPLMSQFVTLNSYLEN
jgi:hypothetical protein